MVATPSEGAAESAAALDDAAHHLMATWTHAHNSAGVPVPTTQLRALFVVERGPVNVSSLASELGSLVSSASRLCDRLETAGLLLRDPGRDRREVTVRLTPEGRDLLDRLRARRRERLARVLARMSPPARAALVWGLTQFNEAAARSSPDDSDGGDGSFLMPA
ncbi:MULTISPECIES: MarR family transcriptional regulator [Actinomadura]|uniref:MarR family transcriptional regulator n=1 Tax=Actinomadura yumaensis TaxID=111807 RepID=A0ABW2CFS7_9ACTN|nr:MarR family transcriptional regulator [Actinomadura sp. J1-007]MWK34913.1 MarR family transcriptional regulator [Actinomadura sp. J1-007]